MRKRLLAFAAGAALLVACGPADSQNGLRMVPMGLCYDASIASATPISSLTCASFTGTGSGTSLTATAVTGLIQPGQTVSGTGVTAGTMIVSQSSGTPGGAGVYTTSAATTSAGASLTTQGPPAGADYAVVCAYGAAINYRDDGSAPTSTAGTGGQSIPSGQCIPYSGTISQLQFIGSGATVGATFYRGAAP